MRVLLVEDETQLAGPVSRELAHEYGHEVTCARSPLEVAGLAAAGRFDVALIDLLYAQLSQQFRRDRESGAVSLTSPRLLATGLTAVHDLYSAVDDVPVALWTSGEANRRLHLLFAYEDMGVRVFCSKSTGTGKVDVVNAALEAAVRREEYVDPVLNAYLPAPGAPPLARTLLRENSKRAIWRALAWGARTRGEICALTYYSPGRVANQIPAMLADLAEIDPGVHALHAPLNEVTSFARSNWEFFLDDVVHIRYP
jgi:DNA-binding NarL/FixJ family response regulator